MSLSLYCIIFKAVYVTSYGYFEPANFPDLSFSDPDVRESQNNTTRTYNNRKDYVSQKPVSYVDWSNSDSFGYRNDRGPMYAMEPANQMPLSQWQPDQTRSAKYVVNERNSRGGMTDLPVVWRAGLLNADKHNYQQEVENQAVGSRNNRKSRNDDFTIGDITWHDEERSFGDQNLSGALYHGAFELEGSFDHHLMRMSRRDMTNTANNAQDIWMHGGKPGYKFTNQMLTDIDRTSNVANYSNKFQLPTKLNTQLLTALNERGLPQNSGMQIDGAGDDFTERSDTWNLTEETEAMVSLVDGVYRLFQNMVFDTFHQEYLRDQVSDIINSWNLIADGFIDSLLLQLEMLVEDDSRETLNKERISEYRKELQDKVEKTVEFSVQAVDKIDRLTEKQLTNTTSEYHSSKLILEELRENLKTTVSAELEKLVSLERDNCSSVAEEALNTLGESEAQLQDYLSANPEILGYDSDSTAQGLDPSIFYSNWSIVTDRIDKEFFADEGFFSSGGIETQIYTRLESLGDAMTEYDSKWSELNDQRLSEYIDAHDSLNLNLKVLTYQQDPTPVLGGICRESIFKDLGFLYHFVNYDTGDYVIYKSCDTIFPDTTPIDDLLDLALSGGDYQDLLKPNCEVYVDYDARTFVSEESVPYTAGPRWNAETNSPTYEIDAYKTMEQLLVPLYVLVDHCCIDAVNAYSYNPTCSGFRTQAQTQFAGEMYDKYEKSSSEYIKYIENRLQLSDDLVQKEREMTKASNNKLLVKLTDHYLLGI